MAKGPWKTASDKAVRDRVRRLPRDMPLRIEAKRLVKEDNDTLGALKLLLDTGDVTQQHIEAHELWLHAQDMEPEDFA
jgi:hypothetical protein